jgi:hypothetical protein
MTSPDGPLDDVDQTILAGINDLWATADPMPAGLTARIKFAIELETVDIEVMRLTDVQAAAARGDEQSRLITFDSESVTIMVSIRPNPDGTIRVDGWLTPAGCHPIELRTSGSGMATTSDEDGRFVIDPIQPGMAQLIVRPTGSTRTVTTPSISL